MLADGIPADLVDNHLAMDEIQAIKYVKRFAVSLGRVFGEYSIWDPPPPPPMRKNGQGFCSTKKLWLSRYAWFN
jgi:hypothetical protein